MYLRNRPKNFTAPRFRGRGGTKSPKKKQKAIIIMLLIVAITAVTYTTVLSIDSKLSPIILELSRARGQAIGTKAMYDAINDAISSGEYTYDDIVSFEKNEAGEILAVKTDIVKSNQLKSDISIRCLERLNAIEEIVIQVPIGNLINGELLSGRGPKIKVRLVPIGSVSAKIENVFESAGINQTRHQIVIVVSTNVGVVLPRGGTATKVEAQVCIAETVLIGKVPENYTYVTDDAVGDILANYGT